MMSAEDIALVKIAIGLCNNPELKREIFCAPGSKHYIKIRYDTYLRLTLWNDDLKSVATPLVRSLDLAKHLQEKVVDVLLLIAISMLKWATYHEDILGHSREQSMNVWNSSFFTQRGLVDNKKSAIELMKGEDLSIKQRYMLACLYCFTDHISDLWGQMTKEEKEEFYGSHSFGRDRHIVFIKCWSYFLVGKIDELRGEKPTFQYMLESAIKNGSKAGVEWCLEKANEGLNNNSILDAAIETVRNLNLPYVDDFLFPRKTFNRDYSWTPNNFFIDILCFLLSKMNYTQQIDFFKKDIEIFHSRSVISNFLYWPYQIHFMKAANLMWEFLPEKNYSYLMMRISINHRSKVINHYNNNIFREFWCNSPESYKRYTFSDEGATLKYGKVCFSLIMPKTDHLTNENWDSILLILSDAKNEEKENMIYSNEGIKVCMKILAARSWNVLDEFILTCISPKVKVDLFKKNFINREKVMSIFLDFVKNDDWHSVESFIKWSSLNEVEINELKKNIIYSKHGRQACTDFISFHKNKKTVDKFFSWCFSLEENIEIYKKELAFSSEGIDKCVCLIQNGQFELLDEFVDWCLSSEEDVRELKQIIVCSKGSEICEFFIMKYRVKFTDGDDAWIPKRFFKDQGYKWEQVEMFLTWVFSSENEMIDFKRGVLVEQVATIIVSRLVRLNQWEEAEVFFAWIGLTAVQIKQLKKETIFNHRETFDIFRAMVYNPITHCYMKYGYAYLQYGSKQDGIELFLRWFLTDKETVLEFRDKFKNVDNEYINTRPQDTNKQTAALYCFNLAIDELLRDLDLEQR